MAKLQQNEALSSQCEIRDLFIAVNLVNDPTAQVEELKSNISPSDLFSFWSVRTEFGR